MNAGSKAVMPNGHPMSLPGFDWQGERSRRASYGSATLLFNFTSNSLQKRGYSSRTKPTVW
jgi:hypothetical protein